jgi:hypothetical protein
MEKLTAARKWFQSNIDSIVRIFGQEHHIQREDIVLGERLSTSNILLIVSNPLFSSSNEVIGLLRTPNYALFVSHSHPDGHVSFYD